MVYIVYFEAKRCYSLLRGSVLISRSFKDEFLTQLVVFIKMVVEQ